MSNQDNIQSENNDVEQTGKQNELAGDSSGNNGDNAPANEGNDNDSTPADADGTTTEHADASTGQAEGEGAAQGEGGSAAEGAQDAPTTLSAEERTEFADVAAREAIAAFSGVTDLPHSDLVTQAGAKAGEIIDGLELPEQEAAAVKEEALGLITTHLLASIVRNDALLSQQQTETKDTTVTNTTTDTSNAPADIAQGTQDKTGATEVFIPVNAVPATPELAAELETANAELAAEEPKSAPVVEQALVGLSPVATIVLAELKSYIDKMHPTKPQDMLAGARVQVALFRTLKKALLHVDGEFDLVWKTILNEFVKHGEEGCFDDRHLFRFYESISTLSTAEMDQYRALVNLLKNTATVQASGKARELVLKQTNFQATIAGLEPIAQQRLQNFYNVG